MTRTKLNDQYVRLWTESQYYIEHADVGTRGNNACDVAVLWICGERAEDQRILTELGPYDQQPIRYVFGTDLADSIRIRYNKHAHDLKFQNQEF